LGRVHELEYRLKDRIHILEVALHHQALDIVEEASFDIDQDVLALEEHA
jgi:hypothetical protein